MRNPRKVVRSSVVLLTTLSACAPRGVTADPRHQFDAVTSLQGCHLREVSRTRLKTQSGEPLYIDADAFVADGRGNVLLAGTPNFVWRTSAEGTLIGVSSDSVFGAVIAPDGSAQLVPAPVDPAQVRGIRATARPEGGWDVVFAEEPLPQAGSTPAGRLWYGVLNGSSWSMVEPIPVPDSVSVDTLFTSSLVRHADTLSWALTRRGFQKHDAISLLQRVGGHWVHETVLTGVAGDVDLAYSESTGLILGVVQSIRWPGPEFDDNSLVLWARRPDWQVVHKVVSGLRDGAVHDPFLLLAGRDLLATWWTDDVGEGAEPRRELRATFVGAEAPNQPVIVLDGNIDSWSDAVPVIIGEALPLWVVHGVQPDGTKELRYVSTTGSHALQLARSPSPYMMRAAAAQPRAGELVVTGFEYEDNRFVFSLLLTHRVECQRTS